MNKLGLVPAFVDTADIEAGEDEFCGWTVSDYPSSP